MQARCYSPEMKRFISADPTGLSGGVNFYTYAAGNPLNSIDPEGLCARPSLFGRTSQFGVRSANFGGFSQFGRTPGIASAYSSFGRPASKPFDFESLRSVGPALYNAAATLTGARLISDAIYGYSNMGDPSKERMLSTHQRISSGVQGLVQYASSLASIAEIGGASAMAGTLTRSEVTASRTAVSSGLPAAGAIENSAIRTGGSGQFGNEFQSILSQVRAADFSTRRNGAVFWTGYHQGNQRAAMVWAKNTGRQTIEMTEGGRWLNSLLNGPNNPLTELETAHIWRAASAEFARGASGTVNAFTRGTTVDPAKVFYGLELKILQKNPNVNPGVIYRRY